MWSRFGAWRYSSFDWYAQCLRANGVIAFKENVTHAGQAFWVDLDDSSVTRSDAYFRKLFDMAGLRVEHAQQQAAWPEDLLPVWMYCLVPKARHRGGGSSSGAGSG